MAFTDKLTAIADAIRAKTGKKEGLTLDQMPSEIASISSTDDSKYTNVLDIVGFQTDRRIELGDEENNVGTDLTGFIKVVGGDVIRLKNVTMPDISGSQSPNKIYCYNWSMQLKNIFSITSDKTANSPVFKDGNLVQFTILEQDIQEFLGDTGWIRILAANIDTKSIITVNEEIE